MDKLPVGPKELYAPPSVKEKLLPLHTEHKEMLDEEWLAPIQSDIRRMPMHTTLNMAEAIIKYLSKETKIEPFDLALAMNRWARGEKLGNTHT